MSGSFDWCWRIIAISTTVTSGFVAATGIHTPRRQPTALRDTDPSPLREGPADANLCDLLNKLSGGSAVFDEGDTAENHGEGGESDAECEGR